MFSFCQIEILTPFHAGKKEFLILFHYAGPFLFYYNHKGIPSYENSQRNKLILVLGMNYCNK